MLVPSLSTSTALSDPQVRPSGIFAQPAIVSYGFGLSLTGACAKTFMPTIVIVSAANDLLFIGVAVGVFLYYRSVYPAPARADRSLFPECGTTSRRSDHPRRQGRAAPRI